MNGDDAGGSSPSVGFVDLSHELADGMAPYPGLPTPRIGPHLDHVASREHYDGEEFFLGKVDMPVNVGTYLDAPFHRFADREDLSQLPLGQLVGLPGIVVDATAASSRGLDPPLTGTAFAGAAVLIRTGWDVRWGTDAYWEPGPTSRRASWGGWSTAALPWSAWTSGTSTTRRRGGARRTRDCCAPGSSSSSTCATSTGCLRTTSGSSHQSCACGEEPPSPCARSPS